MTYIQIHNRPHVHFLIAENGCSGSARGAINYPGAVHMGYISNFLHQLGDDFLKLRPNQRIIAAGNSTDYDAHIQATVASDRSFALIYSASDSEYTVNLSQLSKRSLKTIWCNPRTNQYHPTADLPSNRNVNTLKMNPPGEFVKGNDWVLVIGNDQVIGRFKPD